MPPQTTGAVRRKPNVLLLIGIIVGALILVGGIIFFVFQALGEDFVVGGCVEQDTEQSADEEGKRAYAVACEDVEEGQPGVYLITKEVEDKAECDDPTQPVVEIDGGPSYCLTPYGSETEEPADEPQDGEETD